MFKIKVCQYNKCSVKVYKLSILKQVLCGRNFDIEYDSERMAYKTLSK